MGAIRYSILGGGKKIRPALTYATASAIGLPFGQVDDIACAVELIHTHSLIHDDLPAMDNDDLRRGRPALHRAFNEALAILAGNSMQTLAFEVLASSETLDARDKAEAISLLARATGIEGMSGGQAIDVTLVGTTPGIAKIETMHRLKTGSLMSTCVELALICADDVPAETREALASYATQIGLCFQIRDDMLDLQSDESSKDKLTYPAVLGFEQTKQELQRIGQMCLEKLQPLNASAEILRLLTRYISERGI